MFQKMDLNSQIQEFTMHQHSGHQNHIKNTLKPYHQWIILKFLECMKMRTLHIRTKNPKRSYLPFSQFNLELEVQLEAKHLTKLLWREQRSLRRVCLLYWKNLRERKKCLNLTNKDLFPVFQQCYFKKCKDSIDYSQS